MYEKERDSLPETPECNVDDILCEVEVLRHLRGLKKNLGETTFRERFPELKEAAGKIIEEIKLHRGTLREALEKCGSLTEEDVLEVEEKESPLLPESLE